MRFGFVCRAGDRLVVAENCAHQLRTSFQSLGSMVLEVGVEALVLEVTILLSGFEIGFGLESGLSIGSGRNLFATFGLSSLTTD